MKHMTTSLIYIALSILAFLWMADTEITFSPFSFKMLQAYKAVGFFLVIIGIFFLETQAKINGINEFKTKLVKEIEKIENQVDNIEVKITEEK